MTAPGLQRLEDELRTLKSQERPAIIRAPNSDQIAELINKWMIGKGLSE